MIRTALYRQRENRLPAILDEKAPVSFKELSQRAAALQAVLPVQKKPAAAALLLPDGPDFLAALFAVLQAGWMAFPLNPQLTPEELSNLLRRAPVPLIFTTTELLPLCQTAVKSFDQSPERRPRYVRYAPVNLCCCLRHQDPQERQNSCSFPKKIWILM